jgi:uncharacterized membrane protein (UPF0127 family)
LPREVGLIFVTPLGIDGRMTEMETMLRHCKLAFWIVSLTLAAAVWAGPARAQPLTIHAGGSTYKFEVELATTPAEREQGLMFRKSMAPNAGMLFLYPGEQQVAFWMKNTLIPLDMLFLRADGSIAHIAHDAVPLDETPIPSNAAVKAVLEVNGGTAASLGIKEGDKVDYPTAAAN